MRDSLKILIVSGHDHFHHRRRGGAVLARETIDAAGVFGVRVTGEIPRRVLDHTGAMRRHPACQRVEEHHELAVRDLEVDRRRALLVRMPHIVPAGAA